MMVKTLDRKAIYKYLFREGVLVAKKDYIKEEHDEIKGVPNLQVIKVMQSLKSRNYIRETFSWQYYYYYLTDEGIQYLREYLHLPAEVTPLTTQKPQQSARADFGGRGGGFKRGGDRGDRGNFRRRDDGGYRRESGGFGRGGGGFGRN